MQYINTPPERFDNLPDYDYSPHYATIAHGMNVHYIDEGPHDATETVLLMHGEPSWSFLYRHMIDPLVAAGYRVLAPDLIGFGRSSKPTDQNDYTYEAHIAWMEEWLHQVDIHDVTLFCQDWGGLIGLRMVANDPDRFARIAVSNTGLPTGQHTPPEAFLKWQAFSKKVDIFPTESVIQGGTHTELTEDVLRGYGAPFPDESYKAGAKIFPSLVPTESEDPESLQNLQVWADLLTQWQKPLITLFGDKDLITKGGHKVFEKLVPGAQGQAHAIIEDGGHFIQEDQGPQLAQHIINFITANS